MYIIQNKRTKDYMGKRCYYSTNDINKARTFNKVNHCTCCLSVNGYDENDYEIIEVEIKIK